MKEFRLKVILGVDKDKIHSIPSPTAKLGRSSSSEIQIKDLLLSREHCMFRQDSGFLFVKDLNSANGTYVNGNLIPVEQEQILKSGDEISVGETKLVVEYSKNSSKGLAGLFTAKSKTDDSEKNDLTESLNPDKQLKLFETENGISPPTDKNIFRAILWCFTGFLILAVGVVAIFSFGSFSSEQPEPTVVKGQQDQDKLEIVYERVQIKPDRLYRYAVKLQGNTLSLSIDDLGKEPRVFRKKTELVQDAISSLKMNLSDAHFEQLQPEYKELSENCNELEYSTLTIVYGRMIVQSRQENISLSTRFNAVASVIETFSKNELKAWAIQYSVEELNKMALDFFEQGNRLYEQRMLKDGNLFLAISAYSQSIASMETLNPKPVFATEANDSLQKANSELDAVYADVNFLADRSINVGNIEEAKNALQHICRMIPKRDDPRHITATQKLNALQTRYRKF